MTFIVIKYAQNLKKKDFILKTENHSRNKKGKREYLNDFQTRELMKLYKFFDSRVDVPRMKVGKQQSTGTLISEEVLLFAKFLRNE